MKLNILCIRSLEYPSFTAISPNFCLWSPCNTIFFPSIKPPQPRELFILFKASSRLGFIPMMIVLVLEYFVGSVKISILPMFFSTILQRHFRKPHILHLGFLCLGKSLTPLFLGRVWFGHVDIFPGLSLADREWICTIVNLYNLALSPCLYFSLHLAKIYIIGVNPSFV